MGIGDTDFGVQVGIGVLGRAATLGVAFLGSILLARVLGPGGYGGFYLLMALVSFLDNPVTGWATACRKRLTEADFPAGAAVGSTLLGIAVAAVAVTVAAFALAPAIASFTGQQDGWLLLSALFVGMSTYLTTLEVLKGTARFGAGDWMMASRDVLRVLAQVGLVLAGYGVAGMVGGMVAANLLLAPVVLYLLGVQPALPTREHLGDVWDFARSSIPNGLVGTAQNRMDVLILGAFVGPAVVGNYEVAMRITFPAMFVAGVASNGLMGRISNRRSRDEEVALDVRNNLAYASLVAAPLFFGAAVLGGPVVVTVFSSQYAGAGAFVAGLALFHLFRSQKAILVSTINGFDRPGANLRISTVVFSLNLVLGVGLLFEIGPIGVVAATVVSEAVGYGWRAWVVRSLTPSVSLVPRPLAEQLASGALMAGVVLAGRRALPLGHWENVLALLALGVLTYFGTLVAVSEQFRGTVRAVAADAGLL